MHIHFGSYNGHILSLEGLIGNLKVTNNFEAFEGSVRSLARVGKYLLAGGYDEMLHIYDIQKNTQLGEINCQQGVITKIAVVGNLVITGGEDGSVMVWKVGTWERICKSKEHKSIEALDVHPSGKMMITAGKEKKLMLWNLLKFIRVFDIRLDVEIKKTLFEGDQIILVADNCLGTLDTSENKMVKRVESKSKIQDALVSNGFVITSHECG